MLGRSGTPIEGDRYRRAEPCGGDAPRGHAMPEGGHDAASPRAGDACAIIAVEAPRQDEIAHHAQIPLQLTGIETRSPSALVSYW